MNTYFPHQWIACCSLFSQTLTIRWGDSRWSWHHLQINHHALLFMQSCLITGYHIPMHRCKFPHFYPWLSTYYFYAFSSLFNYYSLSFILGIIVLDNNSVSTKEKWTHHQREMPIQYLGLSIFNVNSMTIR